jgi:hypothetical protein
MHYVRVEHAAKRYIAQIGEEIRIEITDLSSIAARVPAGKVVTIVAWAKRPRLEHHSPRPSASQSSRSRFRWRNALRQLTHNTASKKRTHQEDEHSDYLFVNAQRKIPKTQSKRQ